MRKGSLRSHLPWLMALLCLPCATATAANLAFGIAASEPVVVSGTPRMAIDVGGVTRYATYSSGSGTASLTFTYAVQPGDFDANGITIASPLDLNGGTLTDLAGNPPDALSFTAPDTSALKVQTYTADFTAGPITNTNANAVSFAIARAPLGASFTYSITSSGGAGSIAGSGTIVANPHAISGLDVSALPSGTLTLSVTVSTAAGGTGAPRSATAIPSFSGVLDALPAAAAAFSVRRLRSGHTGPLLRVRRSTDNATQDVASTIGGDLDAATLASFCGAATCMVATWYDQSVHGRHAVQLTPAYQPRILSGGTMDTEGGRPAVRSAAVGQFLDAGVIPGQTVDGTFNAVARCADTSVSRHVMGDRDINISRGRIIRALAGGTSYFAANIAGAQVGMPGVTGVQSVITAVSSGSAAMVGALDGVTTTGSTNSYYLQSTAGLWIGGGGSGQSSTGDWIGTISEVMVFSAALSTSARQTLERNQGSYYGISVQ